jgi:hypothetical protein
MGRTDVDRLSMRRMAEASANMLTPRTVGKLKSEVRSRCAASLEGEVLGL